ncbi:MAG: TIGR03943 family protein [Chloroflexi bacterium]|nr:MAG: TIGR03943 family protein [Chloroflexota bacterium]
MDRFLKTLILILLGALLFMRVVNGTVLFYINQRFVLLTWLAVGGFFLVGASYYLVSGRHQHDHDHDHGNLSWIGLLIVALPILLGWLVPPQPLGAAAMENREISVGSLSSVAPPKSGEAQELLTSERNILDWLTDFQAADDLAAFVGEEAVITGFVYRDSRFAENQFMVSRFTVSCCVADAAPIGLVVDWADTPELPSDQWVEVRGHFELGTFAGETIPILTADDIVMVDPPAQPYLYL